MRARASILAWGSAPLAAVIGIAIVILMVAAPWEQRHVARCAVLESNIDAVRNGADRRASDTLDVSRAGKVGGALDLGRGNFPLTLTLDQTRACLGDDWQEVHARAEAEYTGDAWVFVRAGWPRVVYVQSHTARYRHVTWRIIVERADAQR